MLSPSRRPACSPDPARLCPCSPMRPGRLATLVAAISVWLASHNGRLATVPRCPGCLLLPAGLLRSSQSPAPATSSTHHSRPRDDPQARVEGLSSSTDGCLDRLATFLWTRCIDRDGTPIAHHHGRHGWCQAPCASRVVRACCASLCSHADLWVHLKFTCTYSSIVLFHPDVLRGSGVDRVVMMLLAMSMGVVIQMNAIFRP